MRKQSEKHPLRVSTMMQVSNSLLCSFGVLALLPPLLVRLPGAWWVLMARGHNLFVGARPPASHDTFALAARCFATPRSYMSWVRLASSVVISLGCRSEGEWRVCSNVC